MSARAQTLLWIAQRASGALLSVFVVVHLATVIHAVRGGLSAQEILGRVQSDPTWLGFYVLFVLLVSIHAPIGMRAALSELTPMPAAMVDALVVLLGLSILGLGLHAAWALYAPFCFVNSMLKARRHHHLGYWAAVVHRLSGVALAIFLPLHFSVLSLAIRGEAALDGFLRWSEQPLVKAAETLLVVALAIHLAGGLRILALELLPWRDVQEGLIVVAGGLAMAIGLLFLFNG